MQLIEMTYNAIWSTEEKVLIQGGEEDKERHPAQLFAEFESEAVIALEIWDLVEVTDITELNSHRTHWPVYIIFEKTTLAHNYSFFLFFSLQMPNFFLYPKFLLSSELFPNSKELWCLLWCLYATYHLMKLIEFQNRSFLLSAGSRQVIYAWSHVIDAR